MKIIWKLRKHFAEKRLKKQMRKHKSKRDHATEVRLEQEISRSELAMEYHKELSPKDKKHGTKK